MNQTNSELTAENDKLKEQLARIELANISKQADKLSEVVGIVSAIHLEQKALANTLSIVTASLERLSKTIQGPSDMPQQGMQIRLLVVEDQVKKIYHEIEEDERERKKDKSSVKLAAMTAVFALLWNVVLKAATYLAGIK